jgi:outer membrane protein assembly factor BamB
VPTPVCDGDYLYLGNDKGLATSLDAASGEVVWGPERTVQGTVSGSPLLADGRLYFTTEEAVTVVLAAGPEFELLAENELDGSYTLSTPVAVGDRLYVRTGAPLWCLGSEQP